MVYQDNLCSICSPYLFHHMFFTICFFSICFSFTICFHHKFLTMFLRMFFLDRFVQMFPYVFTIHVPYVFYFFHTQIHMISTCFCICFSPPVFFLTICFSLCVSISFSIGFFHIVFFFPYVVHVPYISICFFPYLSQWMGFSFF